MRERVKQTALTASAKHKSVSDGWKMKILVLFPVSSLEEGCREGISEETTCSHHSILQIHHRRADSSWFIIWSLPLCKYFTDFSQWCNPNECTLLWIIGEMKHQWDSWLLHSTSASLLTGVNNLFHLGVLQDDEVECVCVVKTMILINADWIMWPFHTHTHRHTSRLELWQRPQLTPKSTFVMLCERVELQI